MCLFFNDSINDCVVFLQKCLKDFFKENTTLNSTQTIKTILSIIKLYIARRKYY